MATDTFLERAHDSRSGKVHLPSEEVAEIQEWLAVSLAMIAGFLDAYGIITYNTYLPVIHEWKYHASRLSNRAR